MVRLGLAFVCGVSLAAACGRTEDEAAATGGAQSGGSSATGAGRATGGLAATGGATGAGAASAGSSGAAMGLAGSGGSANGANSGGIANGANSGGIASGANSGGSASGATMGGAASGTGSGGSASGAHTGGAANVAGMQGDAGQGAGPADGGASGSAGAGEGGAGGLDGGGGGSEENGCPPALPLACGDSFDHSTLVQGRPNTWGLYSSTQRAENGRETIYRFSTPSECEVVLRLKNLSTDLDLLRVPTCDSISSDLASSTPIDLQTVETLSFTNPAGQAYYVVVDGYAGAEGSYTLEAECTCN